jgi:long-subunit fatty acid transport protein
LNNQVNNGIYDNEAMAYDTYLINFYQNTSGTGKFDSEVYPGSSLQREKITETGSQNQWNIAYGANYKDFLYIGGGIGIQTINYQRQRVFTETQTTMYPVKDANGNPIPKIFDNLTLTDNLTQNGTGFNLNIGAIVRPVEFWRIGASFTSPTWHSITENYNASLNVNYNGYQIIDNGISKTLNNVKSNTLQLDSDLTITTPLRINTGTSVIIAKKGFLSVDAEYVNYASSKISATFNVDDDNSEIQNNYAATWNFRAGGELRLDKFRLRLGAAHYGTPYKTKDNINQPKIFITGGVGYYSKKNFFDITIVQQTNTVAYQIYKYSNDFVNRIGNPPVAALQTSRTNVVFTAGFFF